jgi:hypothetical protein
MKLYNSFLVRCWLIRDSPKKERVVVDVEHIQTGGHMRAASLDEIQEWVLTSCRAAWPGDASPDEAHAPGGEAA